MNTRELIDAIYSGDKNANEIFLDNFSSRVTNRLEVMKVDVASSLLDGLDVEQVDEALESEFKDLGKRRNDTGRELEDENYQEHTYKVPKGLKPKFDTPVSRYKMRKKTNEDVEQVDEAKYQGLSRDTLAKYNVAAARRIRSSTSLARKFDDEAATQRRRGNKEDADANQSLSSEFQRAAKNRIRGIGRATERLAREEVEQIDELALALPYVPALAGLLARRAGAAALRQGWKAMKGTAKMGGAAALGAASTMLGGGGADDVLNPSLTGKRKGTKVWHVGPDKTKDPVATFYKEPQAINYTRSNQGMQYWKGMLEK